MPLTQSAMLVHASHRPMPHGLKLFVLATLACGAVDGHTKEIMPVQSTEAESRRNPSHIAQLPAVTATGTYEPNGSAKDGYLVKKITGAGPWGERDLQDTPYSMTVIPESLIENVNAKDMDQIFRLTPATQETGKIASDATGAPWVTMRGFQVTNPIINGIPFASRVAGIPMMQDIERVEIISGATGFLYGGGRVGGAVNYVTKKPTLDPLRTVSLGSYGGESYFGHIDLGGQIDKAAVVGYRLNALYQDGKTARKEDKEQKAISLVLDFKPHDDFYTDVRLSYKDTVAPGPTIFWSTNDQVDRTRAGIHRNRSFTPDWLKQEFTSKKIENSVRWNLNDVMTLRTGLFYERVDKTGGDARMRYLNNTVLATSWFGNYALQNDDKIGATAYLDSRFTTFEIAHALTVGYSSTSNKTKSSTDNYRSYQIPNDITLEEFSHYPRPDTWGSVGKAPRTRANKIKYTNILIGDDIQFNKQWSALVGVNYASVENKNYRKGVTYDKSALTPTLSLLYKPVKQLTTYATYIESLENGTIVGSTYLNADEVLGPYISKQYELGIKYSLDHRALLTAAIFRLEKANSYELDTQPSPTLTQDGRQVHQGIELGITGKVTNNLTLIAGGTALEAKVTKTSNAALKDKKATGVASRMAKIYAEYRVPGMPGLSISGGTYYTSKKYDNRSNTQTVPAYTVFDLGVRYTTRLGNYPTTLNFTLQNVSDKVYWSNNATLGDPRTFAFTVKTMF